MKIVLPVVLLIGFCLVHFIKLMRLYLILVDRQIPFERFLLAYMRTTLLNLVVPFKLGEIYRVIVFSRLSKGAKTGFFSVLIDRFFDTFALVLILLPYQLLSGGKVTIPVMLLGAFLIGIVMLFIIFPSTFAFLNRYIIMAKTSKRSMMTLKALEVTNDWYEYAKKLVTGRYGIMILLSLGAWMVEMLVFAGFAGMIGENFGAASFAAYIDSILSLSTNSLNRTYTLISVIIVAVLTVLSMIYFVVAIKRNNSNG